MAIDIARVGPVNNVLERVEGIFYDVRLNLTLSQRRTDLPEQVVIIDIDEKSMQEQGRYPWSRAKVADLVNKLSELGAVVIAFDIFFPEPEINPVDSILNMEVGLQSDLAPNIKPSLLAIKQNVDADLKLAQTISQSETVLGFLLTDETKHSKGSPLVSHMDWDKAEHTDRVISRYAGAISNIAPLQEASLGLGFINSRADSDGFIRRAALILEKDGELYPSIALEAARLYTLSDHINVKFQKDDTSGLSFVEGISLVDRQLQTDEYGHILVPFKGPAYSFPYISATDVLNNRVSKQQIEGSVVFIGTSAVGLADLRATSVGLQYPGVEVHANVFEGIMNPDIVPAEPDWSKVYTLIKMLLIGVLLSMIMINRNALSIVCIGLIVIVLIGTINAYFWSELHVSLRLFLPLLLVFALTIYYVFVGFIVETNTKRNIQNMFGQYVPPEHIEKLIVSTKNADISSERREMTVLFADIRSFTTLSESLSPSELSLFLNEYLSTVTEIIFKHGGTIDKYVGDMVMAFWNAPLTQLDHAQLAVDTAQEIIKSLEEINVRFESKGWPPVQLGIGLSTGDMNVGDMGSQYRKAYTVLGDVVNLGSRIESLTKYYGVDILVSEQTKTQASKGVYRIIDKVTVVGKTEPICIYEPIANSVLEFPEVKAVLELHKDAFSAYYERDWSTAKQKFSQLTRTTLVTTQIYSLMLERINNMDIEQLPADWSGQFIHSKK